MKFKGKIFLARYPWNLVILNTHKFTRSDQFKSNPNSFNCNRANRLSGLIGEWLEVRVVRIIKHERTYPVYDRKNYIKNY